MEMRNEKLYSRHIALLFAWNSFLIFHLGRNPSFLISHFSFGAQRLYLPSQLSGLSFAVSLRNWNWRMLSCPMRPSGWRVVTF